MLSPCSLQQNQKQRRRRHFLRCNKTKNKKEMAALLFSPSSMQQNQKQKGNGSFVVVAFFNATKPKTKRKW
jgi:hypothetical protein